MTSLVQDLLGIRPAVGPAKQDVCKSQPSAIYMGFYKPVPLLYRIFLLYYCSKIRSETR
jgi:hypothetical protein